LGPAFVLEPVVEQRLQLLTISRISRVKAVKSGTEIMSTPPSTTPPPFKDRAAVEKARREFLEAYMKKLP
jgi:hypothetical protein